MTESQIPVRTETRRKPLHPSIDEAMIERLVRRFYERARRDARLGPIFAGRIGEDWEPHLRKMFDFWSSVMRMTGRYHGRPVPAHQALSGLEPGDFGRWLKLFDETAHEICPPEVAALFVNRAEMIARSLRMAVFPARAEPGGPPDLR